MKKIIQCFCLGLGLFNLVQCKTSQKTTLTGAAMVRAAITREGFINCFEPGLTAGGKPVWCEASAIFYDGKVTVATDKDMPDHRSSVFYWLSEGAFEDTTQHPTYYTQAPFQIGKKYEDFAGTPSGRYVFLSTAFDRVKYANPQWDGYNTILYWQKGANLQPRVLTRYSDDVTSVNFRPALSKVLGTGNSAFSAGVPYFKLEGLAATDSKLFFGVREEGRTFSDFKHQIKVVAVSYFMRKSTGGSERLVVGDDYKLLLSFDPSVTNPELPRPLGLSSIEYDAYNKRFLILTSYENGESLGAYLWTISEADLMSGKQPQLVRDAQGQPLAFTHKAEDIAVVDGRKLLIIHDDDRVRTQIGNQQRQPNQAAYSVVEFK